MDTANSVFAQRVALLVDRLARLTRELQFCGGLNPAQWEALRFLARANWYSRTPGALAEFLGATKGTASQTLISLEAKGYVTRVRCPSDRRQIELKLTPAGEALLREDPICSIEKAAARMDGADSAPLIKVLSRLLHELQDSHNVREFGVCKDCTLFCVNAAPEPGTDDVPTALHRCGLTSEALPDTETSRICVNFKKQAV